MIESRGDDEGAVIGDAGMIEGVEAEGFDMLHHRRHVVHDLVAVVLREMPRRRSGRSESGRQALFHALAHIELNAVDLAWDLIARFTGEDLPRAFYDDWVAVADDEARHFALLSQRLTALDAAYGDLPAHDGLWQAAQETAHDLLARLAVVPLVLEARGLDVTPGLIAKLETAGDARGAAVLRVIFEDEIAHVAAGKRWFDFLCARRGLVPGAAWRDLVGRHFKGALKPPFNAEARRAAGLAPSFYAPRTIAKGRAPAD